jgi:hypothetical protein
LFSITAALAMAETLPHSRLAAFLARPGRDLFQFRSPNLEAERELDWRAAILPLAVVFLASMLQATGARVPVLGRGWVQLDPQQWPIDVLPELRREEQEHPEGSRIFNDFLYGGFLIYFTPGLKVFIDDRCELYGDEWLTEYSDAMQSDPKRIDRWLEMYNFSYALVARRSTFDRYLEQGSGWAVVKRTDSAVLYERRIVKKTERESLRGISGRASSEAGTFGGPTTSSRGNANGPA